MFLLTVTQVELPRIQYLTVMSVMKSLTTLFLTVMISSEHLCVFMHDLSDNILHNIFDAWWASINFGSMQPITWNKSTHSPSWRFYLHCIMEETSIPGIIWIISAQVLRHPSEYWTCSIDKPLLSTVYIAKLNESTVSEVNKLTSLLVDETALAWPKRHRSRGIRIVRMQKKFKLNI
jgi:hypothetical protein